MVSVEEKLLVNVLYKEEREALQGIDISNVNFENLMKLASKFLYNDGDDFHFMNTQDYNQISLSKTLIDNSNLLKEGALVTVIINSDDGLPLSVEMPASVVLEVVSAEPGVKGNTATNATKPATVETGAIINVPLFINEGDKIKIETEKGTYKERYKE